jgi:hypothetical protein
MLACDCSTLLYCAHIDLDITVGATFEGSKHHSTSPPLRFIGHMRDLRILDTALQPTAAPQDAYTATDSDEHLLARFLFAVDEADRLPNSGDNAVDASSSSNGDARLQEALRNRGNSHELFIITTSLAAAASCDTYLHLHVYVLCYQRRLLSDNAASCIVLHCSYRLALMTSLRCSIIAVASMTTHTPPALALCSKHVNTSAHHRCALY